MSKEKAGTEDALKYFERTRGGWWQLSAALSALFLLCRCGSGGSGTGAAGHESPGRVTRVDGGGPTGVDAGRDAGSDAGGGGDSYGSNEYGSACDHFFAATYLRCGGPTLPAAEAQRRRARFEQVCENQKALPGSGVTDASLEACAAALDRSPCELPNGNPAVCNFQGSLGGGEPCNEGLQCQSGRCTHTQIFLPGFGQAGPITCGTCDPPASTGEVCGYGDYNAGCVGDGVCIMEPGTDTADAGMPTFTCVSPAEGNLGDECDDLYKVCKVGLYCSAVTSHCERLARAGEACGEVTGYPGGCAGALACVGAKCALGSEGDFCQGDLDCAPGLGCGSPSLQPSKCEAVSWGGAGEPCDGYRTRCRVGSCDRGGPVPGTHTCPTVLADGAPCTVAGCDTFAICFRPTRADSGTAQSGTCTLLDSTVCN